MSKHAHATELSAPVAAAPATKGHEGHTAPGA